MTNYSAKSVSAYISAAPKEARAHLREIRAAIKSAVPKAEEGISYGKPYYKYHGMLAGFDAYKNHIGFEIWTDKLESVDRKKLEDRGYKTGSRTFQISHDQNVPSAVIKRWSKRKRKLMRRKAKRNDPYDKCCAMAGSVIPCRAVSTRPAKRYVIPVDVVTE